MAIVSVVELNERSGTSSIEQSERGWIWNRTYKRVFLVATSNKNDDAIVVRTAVDPVTALAVPILGSVYFVGSSRDFLAYVQSVEPEEVDKNTVDAPGTGSYWTVTVNYAPFDPSQAEVNPTARPIQISWSDSIYQMVIFKDINGNAITNSAGDYFDPPVEGDDSRPLLTIVRNELSYDPIVTKNYRDAVNQDAFWGFEAGVWKMKSRKGTRVYNPDAGTPSGFYWEVTYEFELNPDGWTRYLLDQGTKIIQGGQAVNAKDANGAEVSSPVLLNGRGGQLAPNANPVFLGYYVYKVLPYAFFGLVNPDTGF